jgi:DNA segregation ATPase FtsK/SpoIIIE, S-DNA-T family
VTPLGLLLPHRRTPPPLDAGPGSLSLFDPIYIGRDGYGDDVHLTLAYRNLLLGGEPGAGKSNAAAQIIAHGALCPDVRLWFFDGKEVELKLWEPLAERFVGPDLADAIDALAVLGQRLNERYAWLRGTGRRLLTPEESQGFDLVVVDELVLFTATYGTPAEQRDFSRLLRDVVARGRAACMPVVASAQRPSSEVVPTSLRDLFGYRWAFRCAVADSSDVILGAGMATRGHDASEIEPAARGVGWLSADGGYPRRVKAAHLSDDDIRLLVRAGLHLRTTGTPISAGGAP